MPIRVIKIDPFNERVTEELLADNKLKTLYREMSNEKLEVDIVERYTWLGFKHAAELWLDENGLSKNNNVHWGWLGTPKNIFTGVGLITSSNIRSLTDKITLDMVKGNVQWRRN